MRSAWDSFSTTKSGSTRASTGRSRSRSAQNVWMVLTCASSRWPQRALERGRAPASSSCASRARLLELSRSRSFSSPAAFSVNVTATI